MHRSGQSPAEDASQQYAAPGQHADRVQDQIVIPDIVTGVLRYGSPQIVVQSKKHIDELHAVEGVHGVIPGRRYGKKDRQTAQQKELL